jgi:hypothetical protein
VHPAIIDIAIEKVKHLLIDLFVGRKFEVGFHVVVGY